MCNVQLRRGVEGIPQSAADVLSYYERWAASIASISMERGTIQQKDIDRYLGVPTEEPTVRYMTRACDSIMSGRALTEYIRYLCVYFYAEGIAHQPQLSEGSTRGTM